MTLLSLATIGQTSRFQPPEGALVSRDEPLMFLASFEREAKVLASLNHPNIDHGSFG